MIWTGKQWRNCETTILALVERACRRSPNDHAADALAKLLLEDMEGLFACRDFPDAMIRLAESRFCLCEEDLHTERWFDDSIEIEPIFGIQHNLRFNFFPPSTIRGPFLPLLQSNPQKGVDFIVRLTNHASTWYGERKWPGDRLEPAIQVRMQIPGGGDVSQWANNRLWCLHRSTSVGPYVVQTALMALESWLMGICEADDTHVESSLLKLLKDSNNVAVTG
jgi:hypothetical protein